MVHKMVISRKHKATIIRRFILDKLSDHPRDIAAVAMQEFGLSRQAVNKYLNDLVKSGHIISKGTTRKFYELGSIKEKYKKYKLSENLQEDLIWKNDFKTLFEGVSDHIENICYYGFTEIVNNAIDHSGGKTLSIFVMKDQKKITIIIEDDGEGIFKKIQRVYNLPDERLALLELSKGKLTTDPEKHTGEGIFFTSHAFDRFQIVSDNLVYAHDTKITNDFLFAAKDESIKATNIFMQISLRHKQTLKEVFDQFANENDDYTFNKTIVPVRLAQYEGENLISRSQGKRLVARFEKFKFVILDFTDVTQIGPAFADEVFRIFSRKYPDVQLSYINTTEEVEKMIKRYSSSQE
jgi:anti-sigma regulatory factor (Ser/Thr protein kinase)